jgi:hypothetical protein
MLLIDYCHFISFSHAVIISHAIDADIFTADIFFAHFAFDTLISPAIIFACPPRWLPRRHAAIAAVFSLLFDTLP